jgi:hypothetical protein
MYPPTFQQSPATPKNFGELCIVMDVSFDLGKFELALPFCNISLSQE